MFSKSQNWHKTVCQFKWNGKSLPSINLHMSNVCISPSLLKSVCSLYFYIMMLFVAFVRTIHDSRNAVGACRTHIKRMSSLLMWIGWSRPKGKKINIFHLIYGHQKSSHEFLVQYINYNHLFDRSVTSDYEII